MNRRRSTKLIEARHFYPTVAKYILFIVNFLAGWAKDQYSCFKYAKEVQVNKASIVHYSVAITCYYFVTWDTENHAGKLIHGSSNELGL